MRQVLPSPTRPAWRRGLAPLHAGRAFLLLVSLTALAAPARGQDGAAFDPPIVITAGGVYQGRWESLDASVPAIRIRTDERVVIRSSVLRGRGHLIEADRDFHVDLTVRDVIGEALPPREAGRPPGRFLKADTFSDVTVENSFMVGTSGIYLHESRPGGRVRILRNRAVNIDGRRSDGGSGHQGFDLVQFVQIDGGVDLRDTEIAWNEVVNQPYDSRVEDVISLHRTSGRPDDPIRVHDNFIYGAYPADPLDDEYFGGGILLGDSGGSHQHAYDNQVVATTNHGLAIAGGRHNRLYRNRAVSCGRLPDGGEIAAQNVGIYIWNLYDDDRFGENAGYGNQVAWAGPDGRNDWWIPDAAAWTDNVRLHPSDEAPSCHAEHEELVRWLEKVSEARVTIGPARGFR